METLESSGFDFIANLPILIFAVFFGLDLIAFVFASIKILTARGDPIRESASRRSFLNAFVFFLAIVAVFAAFSVITFFLKRGEAFNEMEPAGPEFPPASFMANMPPAPYYITIAGYHFWGPYLLTKNNKIETYAALAVLCKNETGKIASDAGSFDLVYLDEVGRSNFLSNPDYNCWQEKCQKPDENLYAAIFWLPTDKYDAVSKQGILEAIKNEFPTVCPEEVLTE